MLPYPCVCRETLMRRISKAEPLLGTRCSLLVALLLPAVATAGCASLPRPRGDENLISARQLSLRGADALQRGQWTEAQSLFSQAVALSPRDERMRSQYAETLWNLGHRESAIEHLELAARLSGENPEVMVRLGEMYLEQGDTSGAAEQAERAIAADRQRASAWALRGDVLRRFGMADESLASYHRALSYQPHYPRVQLAIAEAYQEQARYRRVLATLRSLTEGYADGEIPDEVWFREGLANKALGRYPAANEAFLAIVRRGEAGPDVWFELAESRWLMGDVANARIAAESALALAPQHAPSRRLLEQLAGEPRSVAMGSSTADDH